MSSHTPGNEQQCLAQHVETPKRLQAMCRIAERAELARTLIEWKHNRTDAARSLGISRRTLLKKIKQYRLTQAACHEFFGEATYTQIKNDS
jgi:DNA-binding NtrC family response regulator